MWGGGGDGEVAGELRGDEDALERGEDSGLECPLS